MKKAIVGVDCKRVEVQDIEIGDVTEWDVRVELECSAISVGTESYCLGNQSPESNLYVSGDAPIGRIVEVGAKAGAAGWAVGERISYFAPQAAKGLGQMCGGHQGEALVNVDPDSRDLLGSDCYVVKVPEALCSERAAFAGISSVSCQGVSMSEVQVGEKALVIGAGLIGQFAAQHFHLRGAEVAIADLHPKRLACATASGIDHTINCSEVDLAEAAREIWPEGADVIADSTGNYAAIDRSVDALRWRGRYVFLAWCKGDNFNLPRFHNRVHGAFFPWTLQGFRVQASWRLMLGEALKIDPLVTHRFAIEDAPKAYEMIYREPENYCGILIDWRK